MKKLSSFLLIAAATMGLASCVNKDDYGYTENYKYVEYQRDFVKKFGDIAEDQSWDFYATMVNSQNGTRSASEVVATDMIQPSDIDFTTWQNFLESGKDNTDKGSRIYSLIAPPKNGKFKAYAVWYAGWYETYARYGFEMGMIVNGDKENPVKLFGSRGVTSDPSDDKSAYTANPGFAKDITMSTGDKFYFYIKYCDDYGNWTTLYGNEGYSTLLYNTDDTSVDKMMVIGFEDQKKDNWESYWQPADFNDVVLYLQGNPDLPIPEAKRFICEDLGTIGDYDFNDIVFDIQPSVSGTGKALVTVQAAGGILNSVLYVNDQEIGEVHKLLGGNTSTMINTGAGATGTPYKKEITVPTDFNLAEFTNFKVVVTDQDGTTREITYSEEGTAPCVIITPIETSWMRETINIKQGYPNFFTKDGSWTKTYNSQYLYQ